MKGSYGAAAWGLLRRRATHILFLGGASLVIDFLRIWPQLPQDADITQWLFLEFPAVEFGFAALVVIGVTLGQVAPLTGWRRFALMCAGGFGGVAVGVCMSVLLNEFADWNFILRENILTSLAGHMMSLAWTWFAVTIGLTLFYLTQEREAQLARKVREAELERVEAQRTVMASRLDVMRARVEPEFLFGALGEVRELYQQDQSVADALVDALIVYLRAALPQMRGQASTLRREVDLASAYAAVLQVPRGDTLSLSQSVDERLGDVALAPMVLLPLAQAAFEGSDAGLRTRFAIDARVVDRGVEVTLTLEGGARPPGWSDEGVDAARRTLEAYYADTARLTFGGEGTRHCAHVSLAPTAFGMEARD
jgi:hypothetical protein